MAFIRSERLRPGSDTGFLEMAPDLVVEVVSPSNTPAEIQAKIREWIEASVRLVWVVYPEGQTVTVIRSLLERIELRADDTLDGADALPGFSCRVSDLFD